MERGLKGEKGRHCKTQQKANCRLLRPQQPKLSQSHILPGAPSMSCLNRTGHFRPKQDMLESSICSRAPQRVGQGFIKFLWQSDFFHCPVLPLYSSFHRGSSLINILHPKLCPTYAPRVQSEYFVCHCKIYKAFGVL